MRASGLLEMVLRGVPAKTYYRVNTAKLMEALTALNSADQCNCSYANPAQQDMQNSHNKVCNPCTTNTENTSEKTTKKFSFGKQRKASEVLSGIQETPEEILAAFHGKQSTPAIADQCFRRSWRHANAGRPLPAATAKRMAMLGKLCSLLGDNWSEALVLTVSQWDLFCSQVALDKGVKVKPKIPTVEFMCAHADVMIAMPKFVVPDVVTPALKQPKFLQT
jgi:hypothetical protein